MSQDSHAINQSTPYLLFLIVYFDKMGNGINRIYVLVVMSYVVLIIQFLLTTGATYGFSHSHERSQIKFTEGLSKVMKEIEINVEPMAAGRQATPDNMRRAVVVMLGLFFFILFVLSYRNTNFYIRNQHAYEDDILNEVIKREGGSWVRPVEGSEPDTVVRVLKSLF